MHARAEALQKDMRNDEFFNMSGNHFFMFTEKMAKTNLEAKIYNKYVSMDERRRN
jgi:hypothetical protein